MFLAISIFLVAINLGGGGLEYLSDYYPEGTYSFYCAGSQDISGSVAVGTGSIVTCRAKDYKSVRNALAGVAGESFSIEQSDPVDLANILAVLKVEQVRSETVDGIYIIYGFSNLLVRGVNLSGAKINVQIAVSANRITVGTPLILGSY